MSESDIQQEREIEVQRELLFKRAIESHLSMLIESGAKAVCMLKPPTGKPSQMEESQFRNLLNVVSETSSVDVVTNFIRYQIGRSPEKWGRNETDFGPTLIRDIESGLVVKAAEQVKKEISNRLGEAHLGDVLDRAYLRLTRLYLGYVMRLLYYCKKREEAKDPRAWENLYRVTDGGQGAA